MLAKVQHDMYKKLTVFINSKKKKKYKQHKYSAIGKRLQKLRYPYTGTRCNQYKKMRGNPLMLIYKSLGIILSEKNKL